jgi:rsbT co-antagonist protein RsbR
MTDASRSRWSEEDLALLRGLGGKLSQIILGEEIDVPDLQRRDELGILANMVSRLARELRDRRRREQEHEAELRSRVEQLQSAYDTQEKLLGAVRSVVSPILEPHAGILLVTLAAPIEPARVSDVMPLLLDQVSRQHPEVVIVHVASPSPLAPDVAAQLLRAGQTARRLGARLMLSGVADGPRQGGIDLSPITPCSNLQEALTAALDLIGYRITR